MARLDWIAARTKPRREDFAARNVVRQGSIAYCPRYYDPLRRHRYALFPNWLFIGITKRFIPSYLYNTYGIASIPPMLPGGTESKYLNATIRDLKSRENEFGNIVLDRQVIDELKIKHGETIRVLAGMYEDREGTFDTLDDDPRYVKITVPMLGRDAPMRIERKFIERAA